MTCYAPIRAFRTPDGVVFQELSRHDIVGRIELPCGKCIGCHMRRASDWELRVMHEASLWERNCFVTLTYARDCLPPDGSLCHRDFQLFMKRLRKHFGTEIRYYMCGEYGPLNLRPHYHACLFNCSFDDCVVKGKSAAGAVFCDSPLLSSLWSHGIVSVQELTRETAGYTARYCVKKLLGPSRLSSYVREGGVLVAPEYAAMSLKPGIGARWFDKFSRDVFPLDSVVAGGVERRPPRYYDKRAANADALGFERVMFARYERAKECFADSTEDRLRVRELVHEARVANFKRSLE